MRNSVRTSLGLLGVFLASAGSVSTTSAATYTLTVQVDGAGAVSRNPTNSVYPEGAVVVVTAKPQDGWAFTGWSGDASGVTNPQNITMNGNKVVAAHFQLIPSYALNAVVSGQGIVNLDPPGGTYKSNTLVSVSALPSVGWVFAGWSGAASGGVNPLAVNVRSDVSLVAVFGEIPFVASQPQNVIADVGTRATFSVQARGSGPLGYRWLFNGSPVNGANTAELVVTNVQPIHAGEYWVEIANAYGAVTSEHATLTVGGPCVGLNVVTVCSENNLRQAIELGGHLTFCCNGTIQLSSTIDVTHDVALDGLGRAVVISGNNSVRLFNVHPGARFSATNMTFSNGRHVGENGTNGVHLPPPLTDPPPGVGLPGMGAAIFNNGGNVVLSSCTLTNHSVVGGRGGVTGTVGGVGGSGLGGAIFSQNGALVLIGTTLSSNLASGGPSEPTAWPLPRGGHGLGGAIYSTNGSVLVLDSVLTGSRCTTVAGGSVNEGSAARGGALFQASGTMIVSNSFLGGNVAAGGDSPFGPQGFPYPGAAQGGAIAVTGGSLQLDRSRLTANTARGGNAYRHSGTGPAQGGAIYSEGTLVADDTTFSANRALSGSGSSSNTDGRGGAIHSSGTANLVACSISANIARGGDGGSFGTLAGWPGGHGMGGGLFNSGQMTATNCTVGLNSALAGSGGFMSGSSGNGFGGGIFNGNNGTFSGLNLTIASNVVAVGSFGPNGTALGANVANAGTGTFALRNTLLVSGGTNGNVTGLLADGGFNISSDGSAVFNSGSSFSFTDPRVGPLGQYGGLTLTMALRPNSPAIDFGDNVGAPAVDQRRFSRPFGSGIDIGAYEFHSNQTELPRLDGSVSAGTLTLTFAALPGTTYRLLESVNLSAPWNPVETIGPFANLTEVTRRFSALGELHFYRVIIP